MSQEATNVQSVSVDNIIYGSFVRNERLQQIVYETFSNTSIAEATDLNIFVDIYSVLKSVFSSHYRTTINNYTDITAGLINLCGHYRRFFRSLSVNTKFYLVFSYNTCDINSKFVSGYNKEFKEKSEIKMFRDLVDQNIQLLEILCDYLPGIYFMKSIRNYESSVMIANLIENINERVPNLIISRDLYPLQLTYLYPYTSYLYPLKYHGQDNSVMIPISEKMNYKDVFWNFVAEHKHIKIDNFVGISPVNFTMVEAMHRAPERCMTQLMNIVHVNKVLSSLTAGQDIKIIPDQLINLDIDISLNISQITSRWNALDVTYMLPYYKNDPESRNIKRVDIRNDSAVNMINSKYFANNPIDLQKL
jgi:hypothetical protein